MTGLKEILNKVIDKLGPVAAEQLGAQLERVASGATETWQRAALAFIARGVERHGADGLKLAVSQIEDFIDGKPVALDLNDLAAASDLLAVLENAEADRKCAVREYVTVIADEVGQVVRPLLAALLGSLL